MKFMGRHIAVEGLRNRARSWGASSGLSTALSLGFGALLLALAIAGPRSDSDATAETATPVERATPEPREAADEAMPPAPVALAMARIALPPPPPAVTAPNLTAPTTEARTLPPDTESSRLSPPASEPAPMQPLTEPAVKPLPSEALAARPALAPPAPTPTPEPALARRSEPAEKRPLQAIAVEPVPAEPVPAKPIKALQAETEPARETRPPVATESVHEKPAERPVRPHVPESPASPVELAAASAPAAPPAVDIRVGDTAAPEAVEGRVLLHILEHGSGPGIVIAWPRSARERTALYSLLAGCYGVRTALLDSSGKLYRADQARAWSPNTDRYSGFLRQVEGQLPASERGTVAAIQRRHPGLRSSSTVRLFPRNVDAVLLGGLRGIVGDRYGDASRISARYSRSGQRVVVENIRVDGAALRGTVALTPPRYCPAAGST